MSQERCAAVFPQVLVACIRDGRVPLEREMASLASKIWNESVKFIDSADPPAARAMAHAALCGRKWMNRSTSSETSHDTH